MWSDARSANVLARFTLICTLLDIAKSIMSVCFLGFAGLAGAVIARYNWLL